MSDDMRAQELEQLEDPLIQLSEGSLLSATFGHLRQLAEAGPLGVDPPSQFLLLHP